MKTLNCATIPKDNLTLIINQENQEYLLSVKIEGETMIFNISEREKIGISYMKRITWEEIKKKEPKQIFSVLSSFMEFIDYLKALSELNKIFIIKTDNKIAINFDVEYLLKKYNIEIDLYPEKINLEKLVDDLCKEISLIKEEKKKSFEEIKYLKNELETMKNKMKNMEEKNNKEIKELKNEIKELKKCIQLKNDENKNVYNSAIMKENEFDIIKSAIETRTYKKVKNLNKLYQATIDGENSTKFHSKCDGIPNTITFIKSAGNKRFGGFTSESWDCSGKYKDDITCFLFSLDKQKIYPIKTNKQAIYCGSGYGPVFGGSSSNDIQLGNSPISKKQLYTYESYYYCNFEYYGDNNALSEDGKSSSIYAIEYEVFEVKFC